MNGVSRFDYRLQLMNSIWTIDCMSLANEIGCRRFGGIGSIMESEALQSSYYQNGNISKGHVYGAAKVASRIIAMALKSEYNLDVVWAQITNVYGIGEFSSRLISQTLQNCIHKRDNNFTSGEQNYDFVYIDDVVKAIYLIALNGTDGENYIIGSSNAKPLKEFLIAIQNIIKPVSKFNFGTADFEGTMLPLSAFDCAKTENDTGFKASISFEDGILRTYSWMEKELQNDITNY